MVLDQMLLEGLVSTIIPVFNRPVLVREAVASVLAQTHRPIEIIIVDDGSTDPTPAVLAELAGTNPDTITVRRVPNGGPGAAREAGRQLVRGEFIQYLDSDDLLLPRKFEWQVAGLRAHPECGVSYGKTLYSKVGETPPDVAWKRTGERIEAMFPSMLESRWWDTSTPLYRRSVVEAAGPWSNLSREEDWEYDCHIARQGIRLHYCREFVSKTRLHQGEMLSRSGLTAAALRDRATAHNLIYGHASAAGIKCDSPEMKHFARELFLLARQCGAASLPKDAQELFELARQASGPVRARGLDFVAYQYASSLFGWTLTGRAACKLDAIRP